MKNLLKNNNVNAFAQFQNAEIKKSTLKEIKGGEDVIIVETLDN